MQSSLAFDDCRFNAGWKNHLAPSDQTRRRRPPPHPQPTRFGLSTMKITSARKAATEANEKIKSIIADQESKRGVKTPVEPIPPFSPSPSSASSLVNPPPPPSYSDLDSVSAVCNLCLGDVFGGECACRPNAQYGVFWQRTAETDSRAAVETTARFVAANGQNFKGRAVTRPGSESEVTMSLKMAEVEMQFTP